MTSNPNLQAMIAQTAAADARLQTTHERSKADDANRRADAAEAKARRAARSVVTDADLERDLQNARDEKVRANAAMMKLAEEVKEKDALILEWMHSNEAFKQLARQYGKKLGITDDQRKDDFANAVIDVAEEDPKFANTKMAEAKRNQLSKK